MSDKKILDDEEMEIDFLDTDLSDSEDGKSVNNEDITSDFELEEINEDDRYELYEDDGAVEYDEELDYDDSVTKNKLTKDQIINRIMIGMGIVIAGFTIFYGSVAYGVLHKENNGAVNNEPESTAEVMEETTTAPVDPNQFVSPYSDANISEDVKKLLNDVKLKPMDTGLYKLDNRVENIISCTAGDSSKTTYEKVRNIYDYVLYYFELSAKSYIDEDTVYEACSSVDYTSYFDMEVIYRANKALTNNAGSSDDYACALTVLFRKLGLEAYYIEGERKTDTGHESHGYTVVVIDGEKYIFDAAYEDEKAQNADVSYGVFCKTLEELSDEYTEEGIEKSMDEFAEFGTLGAFSFKASISADNGDSASGSIQYKKGNNEDGNAVNASGDIEIYVDEKVYLQGSVSGSSINTWKLIAKIYDEDMNYVTESVVYKETTDSQTNKVYYSPGRVGNIRLVYMVTDENGRTCTISKMIAVKGRYVETTKEEETESDREEETTTPPENMTEETPATEPPTDKREEEPSPSDENSESDASENQGEDSTTSPDENGN